MARQVPQRVVIARTERLLDAFLLGVGELVKHGTQIWHFVVILNAALRLFLHLHAFRDATVHGLVHGGLAVHLGRRLWKRRVFTATRIVGSALTSTVLTEWHLHAFHVHSRRSWCSVLAVIN